jgi:hypothetical protein
MNVNDAPQAINSLSNTISSQWTSTIPAIIYIVGGIFGLTFTINIILALLGKPLLGDDFLDDHSIH